MTQPSTLKKKVKLVEGLNESPASISTKNNGEIESYDENYSYVNDSLNTDSQG